MQQFLFFDLAILLLSIICGIVVANRGFFAHLGSVSLFQSIASFTFDFCAFVHNFVFAFQSYWRKIFQYLKGS